MVNEQQLLSRFPKVRTPISEDYKPILEDAYLNSREGRSFVTKIALKLEEWMHRKVAEVQNYPTLEIGAGTLNHLPFESLAGPYDVVEPQKILYEGKPGQEKVRAIYPDIKDVPEDRKYARIISIAVLEHLTDLPTVIARAALMLKDGGEFRAGIPTEGGLLWFFAWRFGTGLGFWLKYRKSYATFQRHEHVNDALEMESTLRLFFEEVEVKRFPFNFRHLSFYTFLRARRPKSQKALGFLDNRARI